MPRPDIPPFRPKRLLLLALVTLAVGGRPAPARGQTVLDLLRSLEQGGGWVAIPVQAGVGSLVTRALPTAGLVLSGCIQVYAGMSGRWEIEARDVLGEGHLEASVAGGESVPFTYRTGPRGQLRVDARWSEPRDTTLLVWVGLGTAGSSGRDPCRPVYGGGGSERPRPAEEGPEGL